ncbi:MAG: hypothetical protein COB15_17230, partial [Flavobacteriales bacterium]
MFQVHAQNIGEDLTKMSEAYNKVNTISMEVSYAVFFDGSDLPNEKEVGVIKKEKNKIYNNEFSGETLINDKYEINVDHENKFIMVNKARENHFFSPVTKINTDTLLKHFDDVKYIGLKKNLKSYSLFYKSGQTSVVDIWLNAKTGFLEKIKITYRGKMEVEEDKFSKVIAVISYNNIQSNISFPKDTFSEKKYISISNKKVLLAPKY